MSFDAPEKNLTFAAKHGLRYRLLSDTDRSLALAFRACTDARDAFPRRITYVIDPEGRIEAALETRSPEAQAAEILADLGDEPLPSAT